MAKNGKIERIEAENNPINGYLFSLCEYSQIRKIYTEKNSAARQETKNPNTTPKKLRKK